MGPDDGWRPRRIGREDLLGARSDRWHVMVGLARWLLLAHDLGTEALNAEEPLWRTVTVGELALVVQAIEQVADLRDGLAALALAREQLTQWMAEADRQEVP